MTVVVPQSHGRAYDPGPGPSPNRQMQRLSLLHIVSQTAFSISDWSPGEDAYIGTDPLSQLENSHWAFAPSPWRKRFDGFPQYKR